MSEVSFDNYWSAMTIPVRRRLLFGSAGGGHLFDTAVRAIETDPQLAVELFFAAYASNPMDGNMALRLSQVEGLLPLFPDSARLCLEAVLAGWRKPDNLSYFLRITSRRDHSKVRSYILSCLEKEPENLFWIQQGLTSAGASSDLDFAREILAGKFSSELAPAVTYNKAFFSYLSGDYTRAFELLKESSKVLGGAGTANLYASIALALGERETARSILAGAVDAQPWRVTEALRLYDLHCGLDMEKHSFTDSLAILLYSYNKAGELDNTLASLHASRLGGAKIFMLDNGSSDGTSEVVGRWQEKFGAQLVRIDLPVNIGAAAARNWLMNLQEVRNCEFALYLDDDVVVEPDWLDKFSVAVRRYPDAGVWGCKVVDAGFPVIMQSVDLHLIQPAGDEGEGPEVDLCKIAPNPFRVSDIHHQLLDAGYFDFMRPCASVTGCCHLFKTAKLLDNGGFSLFLSPSQYDDMEHDLRICLKGDFAVYTGHLKILHCKNTGAASRVSVVQEGNALGNKYKMQAMHPRSEVLQIMADEERLLQSDLMKKLQYLREKGVLAS